MLRRRKTTTTKRVGEKSDTGGGRCLWIDLRERSQSGERSCDGRQLCALGTSRRAYGQREEEEMSSGRETDLGSEVTYKLKKFGFLSQCN